MASIGTLIWMLSLAAVCVSEPPLGILLENSTSPTELLDHLSADVKEAAENLTSAWGFQQSAALLVSLRKLMNLLQQQQLRECHNAEPKTCPAANVPANGGLVCLTINNRRFCKPMCNHGYDFAFLRRFRVFDECSEQTSFKWKTQYIGGNTLAECKEALIQMSGTASAYFPKDRDCLTTKSQAQDSLINSTVAELHAQDIEGTPSGACLVCG